MKSYTYLAILALASLLTVANGYKQEVVESPKQMERGIFDTISSKFLNIFASLKESKKMGQERQKKINYGCVWKVCSRPIFRSNGKLDPKQAELKKIAQLELWLKYGLITKDVVINL